MEGDLELAMRLADLADSISLPAFLSHRHSIRNKPDATPVTATDEAVEQVLRAELTTARPNDAVLGEEGGSSGSGDRRWIIDPIDGTKNFIAGIPLYGTLIALEEAGRIRVAVVSMPALGGGTRYWAVAGSGAWKKDGSELPHRLAVNGVSRPEDGVLAWSGVGGLPPLQERRFHRLRRRFYLNRKVGNTWAHMLVAEGAAAAATGGHIHSWDVAAPRLIIEEAGGRMTTWEGVDGVRDGTVVSSNGRLHSQLLVALSPPLRPRIRQLAEALSRRHRVIGERGLG